MGTLLALYQGEHKQRRVRGPDKKPRNMRGPKHAVVAAAPPVEVPPPPSGVRCALRCRVYTSELGCGDPCVLDEGHEGRCMCKLAVRIAKAVRAPVDDVARALKAAEAVKFAKRERLDVFGDRLPPPSGDAAKRSADRRMALRARAAERKTGSG